MYLSLNCGTPGPASLAGPGVLSPLVIVPIRSLHPVEVKMGSLYPT